MFQKLLRSLLAVVLLAAPQAVLADHLRSHLLLTARLSGDQETPAVATSAQGVAAFTINQTRDTLFVQAAFSGLSGAITGAHVHEGAVGVAGSIIIGLVPMVRGNRLSGYLTGNDITPTKLAKFLRGQYYINIHTAAHGGGEIRGQIRLESEQEYVASLTGSQEVPAVSTPATGLGIFTLSQNQEKLTFRVVLAGLSSALINAHFHAGAVGMAGAVVVPLFTFVSGNVIEGEIMPTASFLTSLAQGQIYINVHTTNNPGGEIRGQLFAEIRSVAHDARLDGEQMVPVVATTAKAVAAVRLAATFDTVYVQVGHTGLSGAPLAINIYNAGRGQANTAANLLGTVPVVAGPGGNATGNLISFRIAAPVLTPAIVNRLLAGGVNVVITTVANPDGEVRGQVYRLAREGYTLSLNGAQEKPIATTSAGYGVGVVSIDRDQSNAHFMSVWGGLTGPATAGHFHTGLSSQSGPVVFSLVPFFDNATTPTAAYGFWKNDATQPFTARRSLQFRNDSIYMNLHTAAFPSGEIRGQVFRGARNLQVVLATQPAALVAGSFGTAPNPFSTALTLSFDSRVVGSGLLRVTDVLGRAITTQTVAVRPGVNTLPLVLPGIAPGLYLLSLQVSETRLVARIAKE